jgi:NAD(P)-dependent dehydrogenase (short-subunit alcohol dehydrogenase family)
MHPIDEQTVLVTGATSGLGRALVQRLAEAGATVVAHGRNASRLARTREEIREGSGRVVDTIQADLAELAQVHRMADEVLERYPRLHALVNNAGVGFGPPGGARELSVDGIELRFAVNHLASYLLARRLAGRLVECAPARIVQVASAGQLALDRADPFTEHHYDGVTAYRRSKLAQVMASPPPWLVGHHMHQPGPDQRGLAAPRGAHPQQHRPLSPLGRGSHQGGQPLHLATATKKHPMLIDIK